MVALHKLLPVHRQQPLPPRQITENAAAEAGVNQHMQEQHRTAATLVAHFGYGAIAGSGYAAMAGKSGLPPVAEGALYGLAVWGGSYLGLVPATGLYRSATDEPASRNALMITSHILWGGALGVIFHALTRNGRHNEE
jgi:putative membrane protein